VVKFPPPPTPPPPSFSPSKMGKYGDCSSEGENTGQNFDIEICKKGREFGNDTIKSSLPSQ
jgi:hypothetical protein